MPRKDWPPDILRNVLVELIRETPTQLLAREMWCSSTGSVDWWEGQKRFSSSLAFMSMVRHYEIWKNHLSISKAHGRESSGSCSVSYSRESVAKSVRHKDAQRIKEKPLKLLMRQLGLLCAVIFFPISLFISDIACSTWNDQSRVALCRWHVAGHLLNISFQ